MDVDLRSASSEELQSRTPSPPRVREGRGRRERAPPRGRPALELDLKLIGDARAAKPRARAADASRRRRRAPSLSPEAGPHLPRIPSNPSLWTFPPSARTGGTSGNSHTLENGSTRGDAKTGLKRALLVVLGLVGQK